MAHVDNPRKGFNFSIDFPLFPINPFLAQEVDIPEVEVDQVEHGDSNHSIKTGGRKKVGNIKIKKILTTTGPDNYFWDWMILVQDFIAGGGLIPTAYKRAIVITELAEDGLSVINTWDCTGCWPTKINGQSHKRLASDNTIEELELSCDIIDKL